MMGFLGQIAAHANTEEERFKTTTLLLFSLMMSAGGVMWGTMCLFYGARLAMWIPYGYGLATVLAILSFLLHKNFTFFRSGQLAMSLLLPFLLQWLLGGFYASGAVMVWAFIALLGALFYSSMSEAIFWGLVYLFLTIASGISDEFFQSVGTRIQVPVTILFVINISSVSFIVFCVGMYFVRRIENEHEQAEKLLLNILPASIATRLKRGEKTIADSFDEVTVLFADLVDFTTFAERTAPDDLVQFLNRIFSSFDDLCKEMQVEKIKTIGDSYMAVCGLPEHRPDHARVIAHLALRMRAAIEDLELNDHRFRLRIGIHSGPVVAGVIGKQKFIYDLWGDTVNTASRMESTGLANEIQITESTYRLIREDFLVEDRGTVSVKGKGDMRTFLLKNRVSTKYLSPAIPSRESSFGNQVI